MRIALPTLIVMAVFTLGILMQGCLPFIADGNDTDEERFLQASEYFTGLCTAYDIVFQNSSPEAQANMREKIDPLITKASRLLDIWRLSLEIEDAIVDEGDFVRALELLVAELSPLLMKGL